MWANQGKQRWKEEENAEVVAAACSLELTAVWGEKRNETAGTPFVAHKPA